MSLQSWKEEFYPMPASEVTPADALDHSLRKWEGLRLKNLQQHALQQDKRYLWDPVGEESLKIDATTCALCKLYIDELYVDGETREAACERCPLAIVRGNVPCDQETEEETEASPGPDYSPYMRFDEARDPEPMIMWLKRAKAHLG